MKKRDAGRWRAWQVDRYWMAIQNRELHETLWLWREELGIDEQLLRISIQDRASLALFGMSGEQQGFYFHSTLLRQYGELRATAYGMPFVSPRDLCLLLWLPAGERAAELFGAEASRRNLSVFFEYSTPLAIVNQADAVRNGCISVDVTCADWLDVERAYDQVYGIRWANDYLHGKGLLPKAVGKRGRPPKSDTRDIALSYPADDPTILVSDSQQAAQPPYLVPFRPQMQGFPTYNDSFWAKTLIVVTGCSLNQIYNVWPQVEEYRKQRYNGFDPSHPQHRPSRRATLQKDALLSAGFEAACDKQTWLDAIATTRGRDTIDARIDYEDSLLREIRRANRRFPRTDK